MQSDFLFLHFLHFYRTQKMEKRSFFVKIRHLSPKNVLFTLFGSHKNVKKAKIKNRSAYVFSKYPKQHFYQVLDQLDHFPETSFNFSAKSGYARSAPKKRKKHRFSGEKNANIWADFPQIFRIDENHLITLYMTKFQVN